MTPDYIPSTSFLAMNEGIISPRTYYKMIADGRLRHVKIGSKILVHRRALDFLADEQQRITDDVGK